MAYMALAKLGAVTVGVNPRLAPAEQVAALDVVRPSLALATADLAEGVPDGVDVEVVTIAADAASLLAALRSRANGNAAPVPVELTDDDPVAIVLTSGTTGRPEGRLVHQPAAAGHHHLRPGARRPHHLGRRRTDAGRAPSSPTSAS